ncbi:MAG: DNA polymerase III subunit delta [Gemmatimonadaceae bacterium]|nr:DNA polymerase III subunit delta [Gemmatimonadaceae bacterium]
MSALSLRDLRTAIAKRSFERAYYIHGDDEYRKDAVVRELTTTAVDAATRDFNYDLLRGTEVSLDRLEAALNMPPMMADRRVVVVRDVNALKKDTRAVLDRYLTHPARDTVLLLVSPAGAKPDKDIEAKCVSLLFSLLEDTALTEWIVQHASDTLGVTLSQLAVALLQEAVGSDAGQLASELDKLASYTNGALIDDDAVRAVVGIRVGETVGDFFDLVAARDMGKALALVDHVLTLPKSGLVPIIMGLTVQTLAIGWARQAHERGVPSHRLESEFFGLLKETGAFPMRAWGEAAKSWSRAVPKWDAESIDRALVVLLAGDRSAKDTRLSSDEQALASIVCSLCAPVRRAVA